MSSVSDVVQTLHERLLRLELELVHQRAPRLADVSKIQVPVVHRTPARSQMQTCDIEFSPGVYSQTFNRYFKAKDRCQIWHNTLQADCKSDKIIVQSIILERDVTNLIETKLIVASAVFRYFSHASFKTPVFHELPLTIKFRLVGDQHDEMTEQEGQNMVNTAQDDAIKDLFPQLYFLLSIDTKDGKVFEGVGTEALVEHNLPMPVFFREAFDVLCKLHTAGYKHGDPHRGNFMRLPPGSTRAKLTEHGVIMIDQDEIKKLPQGKDEVALANLQVVIDLNYFLIHHNPYYTVYFTVLKHMDVGRMRSANNILYNFNSPVKSPLRMPLDVYELRLMSERELRGVLKDYTDYKAMLEEFSLADIHNFYRNIFHDVEEMKRIDGIYSQYLMGRGIRV